MDGGQPGGGFGDAEIGELHEPGAGQKDVLGGYIPVHQALPAVFVKVSQAPKHLRGDVCDDGLGKRAAVGVCGAHQLPQRSAFDALHGDEVAPGEGRVCVVGRAIEVQGREQVGVIELRCDPCFFNEEALAFWIVLEMGKDELDGDGLDELARASNGCGPDLRHAASSDAVLQLVLADLRAFQHVLRRL